MIPRVISCANLSALEVILIITHMTRAQHFAEMATIWPQQTRAEKLGGGVLCLLFGGLGPSAEASLPIKWRLDPSSRLATLHQRHIQTGHDKQDGQRSDNKRSPIQMSRLLTVYLLTYCARDGVMNCD